MASISPSATSTARGSIVAPGTLKITPLTLDKDAWENVPPIVLKTFNSLSNNLNSIKRWADKQEDRAKRLEDFFQQTDARVEELEADSRETSGRLQHMSEDIKTMTEDSGRRFELLTACLGALFRTVRAIYANLGKAFSFEMTWSEEERVAMAALQTGDDGTGEPLRVLCTGLEQQLGGLEDTFNRWASWRAAQEERHAEMQQAIEELSATAGHTRERLLAWRERIKENAHVIRSLGAGLEETRGAVQELQAAQVRHHDVDEAVGRSAKELRRLLGDAEARTDEIAGRVEVHVGEVERLVEEAQRQTDDRIEAHSSQVSQLLERSLNPVNAYLNTMHVKSDVVRIELDSLNEKVPKLASSIEEVAAELRRSDESGRGRALELGGRVDKLVLSLSEWGEQGLARDNRLSGELEQRTEALARELAGLREALGGTADALEAAKRGDLSRLARDLSNLEQKVAKWVHAHPLPAKVSEARLFSLETRLAEETDARLHLEQHVKTARGRPLPATLRDATALPRLLPQQPPPPEGVPHGGRRPLPPGGRALSGQAPPAA